MNASSQQDPCSITLDNDIVITLPAQHTYAYDSMIGDINLSTTYTTSDTITISGLDDTFDFNFGSNVIWENAFPDFLDIKNMCKEYPALEKALENFKTIYELVKDDYANKIANENK